jgi:hypothetical protein
MPTAILACVIWDIVAYWEAIRNQLRESRVWYEPSDDLQFRQRCFIDDCLTSVKDKAPEEPGFVNTLDNCGPWLFFSSFPNSCLPPAHGESPLRKLPMPLNSFLTVVFVLYISSKSLV